MAAIDLIQLTDENIRFFQLMIPKHELQLFSEGELEGIGAITDNKIAGVLLLCITDETMFISHVFVAENCRRSGVASKMMDAAKEIAGNMQLEIETTYSVDPENVALAQLLEKSGFSLEERGGDIAFSIMDLQKSKLYNSTVKLTNVFSLDKIAPSVEKALKLAIAEEGMDFLSDNQEIYDSLDRKLSSVILVNKVPKACLLMKPVEEGEVDILYYWLDSSAEPLEILKMVHYGYEQLKVRDDFEQIRIEAHVINEKLYSVLVKSIPNIIAEPIRFARFDAN